MIDVQRFIEQYKNVVEWNAVARGDQHIYTQDAFDRQTSYVKSEIEETLKGLSEDNSTEVLDGVADVFVTMAYKHFLSQDGLLFEDEIQKTIEFMYSEGELTFENDHELAKNHLMEVLLLVNSENESEVFDTSSLCSMIELMKLTETYYSVDVMDVIEHVMNSNWSKYPKVGHMSIKDEVDYISEKNPDRKDIVGTVNERLQVVVYRDDKGAGKILKPSTFWNADCSRFL